MTTTPKLTTWTGRLTDDGDALAAWLAATGRPIPTPARPTLLPQAAAYFDARPDEAAALWHEFQAERSVTP